LLICDIIFLSNSSSLRDRIAYIRDLFRRSRTDVDGAVNRKQIFYTTIVLLFEAVSKYMQTMDPGIFGGGCLKPATSTWAWCHCALLQHTSVRAAVCCLIVVNQE